MLHPIPRPLGVGTPLEILKFKSEDPISNDKENINVTPPPPSDGHGKTYLS